MKLTVKPFDDLEVKKATGLNTDYLQERGYIVLNFEDEKGHTSTMYLEPEVFNMVGVEYIRNNTKLEYSVVCKVYFAKLTLEPYKNSLIRYPAKMIPVEYIGTTENGLEIYRSTETKKYYTREVSQREKFSRWLGHGDQFPCGDSGRELRSNLVFSLNGNFEVTQYSDWSGAGCCFNKGFCSKFGKE